jgi:hypothetical protein
MKCDNCGMSVSEVRLFYSQGHWCFPPEIVAFCKQCVEKKNLEWVEVKEK